MSNIDTHKKNTKMFFTLLFIIIFSFVSLIYFFNNHKNKNNLKDVKISGVVLPKPKEINDFKLTTHLGKSFTKSDLQNHWTMMFFGFTNCAMVCPTTMAAMNGAYQILQKELPSDQLPQIVLVTVDPERDTIKRLREYINSFNSHFIGARAELSETEALEKQLYIVAAKMQADNAEKDQYTINHSAEILLFNPKGELQAYISYPPESGQLAKDYKTILSATVS